MFKNCWSYALPRFEKEQGWLFVRFTKLSSAKIPSFFSGLGYLMVVLGIILFNYGMYLRTSKWMHVYFAKSPEGPFYSYEPDKEKIIDKPPFSFPGREVERETLK